MTDLRFKCLLHVDCHRVTMVINVVLCLLSSTQDKQLNGFQCRFNFLNQLVNFKTEHKEKRFHKKFELNLVSSSKERHVFHLLIYWRKCLTLKENWSDILTVWINDFLIGQIGMLHSAISVSVFVQTNRKMTKYDYVT